MSETDLYSSDQVMQATGITYRQLDYWCRAGVLKPAIEANGSGTQRRFTGRELQAAGVLARILDVLSTGRSRHGLIEALTEIVSYVRDHGPVGSVELAPGIALDLEVLDRAMPATTGGGA